MLHILIVSKTCSKTPIFKTFIFLEEIIKKIEYFELTDDPFIDKRKLRNRFRSLEKAMNSFCLQLYSQITTMKADPILFKHGSLLALQSLIPIFGMNSQESVVHPLKFLTPKDVDLRDLPGVSSSKYLNYPSKELHENAENPEKQVQILYAYWSEYLRNHGFCQGEKLDDCIHFKLEVNTIFSKRLMVLVLYLKVISLVRMELTPAENTRLIGTLKVLIKALMEQISK